MKRKIPALVLVAPGMMACLDREYRNPFLSSGESELEEEWKRDLNGNGIADSVEFYLGNCEAAPAECLRRAREAAAIAESNAEHADTVIPPPEDTLPTIPPPRDTIPVVPPPRDTIRDTIVVVPPTVAVTGIEASAIYIPMGVPKATPSVHVLPRSAKNQGYTLASLDEAVVRVSGTDLVPVKPGSAQVRARSAEGGFAREFTATVVLEDTNTYETAITVALMEMTAGDPARAPEIAWKPANVTHRGYSLASSDPAIVLVVKDGGPEMCLPVTPGKASLTLTTTGKGLTAEFEVTVKPRPILTIPVSAISAEDMLLDLGDSDQAPEVTIFPALATRKAYTLISDEPSIVSVSGTALHASAKGKAVITLTSVDGPSSTFTATVRVRVKSVSVSDLTLARGERAVPKVTISPADADDPMFTLKSDDENIVRINGNEITARRRGKAVVSVLTRDGNKTASFTVTVNSGGRYFGNGGDDERDAD